MNELISIIVPVYNAQKTLHRCMKGLLSQTYKKIEILLIDDGSTDQSGKICDEYALKDNRVRVFHKQNAGESSARNLGLEKAKGSWITFCDDDDFVNKYYIYSFLFRKCLNKDCIYITGEKKGFSEKDLKKIRGIYRSGILDEEMLDLLQKNAVNWGKLYSRKVINRLRLRFNENVFYGGDKLFTMQYLTEIKEVVYNRKYFPYNYINKFNIKKFMRNFEEELINYRTIIKGLTTAWNDTCKPSWFVPHFKLLFYSVFYEKISNAQKKQNLQKIRDEIYTKEILQELIKQKGKTQFLWQLFLKRRYTCICIICNFIIPKIVNIFAKEGNIKLKKFLKNIA